MLESDRSRSALQFGIGAASPLWPAFAVVASASVAYWWFSRLTFGQWRPELVNLEAVLEAPTPVVAPAEAVIPPAPVQAEAVAEAVAAPEAKPVEALAEIIEAAPALELPVKPEPEATPAPVKAAVAAAPVVKAPPVKARATRTAAPKTAAPKTPNVEAAPVKAAAAPKPVVAKAAAKPKATTAK